MNRVLIEFCKQIEERSYLLMLMPDYPITIEIEYDQMIAWLTISSFGVKLDKGDREVDFFLSGCKPELEKLFYGTLTLEEGARMGKCSTKSSYRHFLLFDSLLRLTSNKINN